MTTASRIADAEAQHTTEWLHKPPCAYSSACMWLLGILLAIMAWVSATNSGRLTESEAKVRELSASVTTNRELLIEMKTQYGFIRQDLTDIKRSLADAKLALGSGRHDTSKDMQ